MISEDLGHKLEKVELDMLGSCKKVTITKDDTILLHGSGDKADITARCDQIRQASVPVAPEGREGGGGRGKTACRGGCECAAALQMRG